MIELTSDVNWMGVLAGVVLAFLIGWLWYSSMLFGPRWATAAGVDYTGKPAVFPLVLQILGLFLMSWFVAIMAREGLLLVCSANHAAKKTRRTRRRSRRVEGRGRNRFFKALPMTQ